MDNKFQRLFFFKDTSSNPQCDSQGGVHDGPRNYLPTSPGTLGRLVPAPFSASRFPEPPCSISRLWEAFTVLFFISFFFGILLNAIGIIPVWNVGKFSTWTGSHALLPF